MLAIMLPLFWLLCIKNTEIGQELQLKLWHIFRTGESTGYPHQNPPSLAYGAFFNIL
jgi:hypothetical protein